jgi:hypothetical protein
LKKLGQEKEKLKVYNVNRKSSDEYLAGLDSAWTSIHLAMQARDLQNKYYSDIMQASVFEVEVKDQDDFHEYMQQVVKNNERIRKKLKTGPSPKEKDAKVL